tara:strand:- start:1172 stop:2215 length:1044 start_codon:yes stop_codon:yes gene_type:complete
MNILIIGLGIVGQRHIRNLKSKYSNINFYTLKNNYSKTLYSSDDVLKGDVYKKYKIRSIKLLDINKHIRIDAAFICLPNFLHARFLKIFIEKKIHTFLEKPGGSNYADLKLLKIISKKIKKNNLKVLVGYHLRFNPLILKLKKIIKKRVIGRIFNVKVENGEHLADYRTYQKYWNKYHSKKKEGGGVLLNQIHEIDYLNYLFDDYKFKIINTLDKKISNVRSDADDTIVSNFIVNNSKERFLLSLNMNSYERPQKRSIKIIGEKGKISANLLNNKIEIFQYKIFKNGILKNKNVKKKYFKFKIKRNDLFQEEIILFINAIKKNKPIKKKYGLDKSIKILELALKLKN